MAEPGNGDRDAAIGDLAIGDDGAVLAGDDAGAVIDGAPGRRLSSQRRWKGREGARHRDHDRLDRVLGRLVVEDRQNTYFVAPGGAADVELLQALQAREHEEVGLDDAVID